MHHHPLTVHEQLWHMLVSLRLMMYGWLRVESMRSKTAQVHQLRKSQREMRRLRSRQQA